MMIGLYGPDFFSLVGLNIWFGPRILVRPDFILAQQIQSDFDFIFYFRVKAKAKR